MKKYNQPIVEEILVTTNDILEGSGIVTDNTNAGFNNPDEIL